MQRPILTAPDKRLRMRSKKISAREIKSGKIQRLIFDLVETMMDKDGIGLAGPQIGELLSVIAVQHKDEAIVLINPKICGKSFGKIVMEEGCLSVPGVFGLVKRPKSIRVKAFNQEGKAVDFKADSILARVIQHEVDHLDGILFIDKLQK
ncbi:MAG: peptide deformylase [Parcubacteria group bacterium]